MNTHSGSPVPSARPAGWIVLYALFVMACGPLAAAAEEWTDISTPLLDRLEKEGLKTAWPGGCSGVVVDRLNGEVTIKVVGLGLWRSADQGGHWKRVDGQTVDGRDETGWATHVDQNRPSRMASFSLDGAAGWTVNGESWKPFQSLGRNWDFGSVDWSAEMPTTIVAAKHETDPPGEVYASRDGGATWKQLTIHLAGKPDRLSMAGALGPETYIYSNGDGIHRTTDSGATWTKVSKVNPQTRIPVFFGGVHYLGSTEGLLVSRDLGATWKAQGTPVNVWIGPCFGKSAEEIAVVGDDGIFFTSDAGATWRKAAALKPNANGFKFTPNWFGCYAWDPVHNVIYASSMGNPVFRLQL